jgi:hypothetical protein
VHDERVAILRYDKRTRTVRNKKSFGNSLVAKELPARKRVHEREIWSSKREHTVQRSVLLLIAIAA